MKKILSLIVALCLLASLASFAGADVTVSEPGVYPIVDEKVELTAFRSLIATLEDISTCAQTVWYEEYTNVHINWITVNSSEANEKLNTSLASGDYPDMYLVGLGTGDLYLYAEDGVIMPLDELIDEHGFYIKQIMDQNPGVREQVTAPDGHIYELFNLRFNSLETTPKMWVYKEWLEAYEKATGKGMPTTTEEFKDLLIYFRDNDMNGNGDSTDEIPLTGTYHYGPDGQDPVYYLMSPFTVCPHSGLSFFLTNEDGSEIECVATRDEFREGLKYMHDLYAEGLLVEETYVQDLFQFRALTSVPKSAVTVGCASAPYPYRLLTKNADPTYVGFMDYEPIPPLEGPEGLRQAWATPYDQMSLSCFIPTTCSNPEVAIKWLDYWYSPEGNYWEEYYGQEGVHWEWADEPSFGGGDRSVKMLVEIGATQNIYWPTYWGANYIVTRDSFDNKAAADTATDANLVGLLAQDIYDPYVIHSFWPQIVWNDDQDLIDEYAELNGLFTDTLTERITEFVVGRNRDINSDADWEAFKAELDKMGLDRYIEVLREYYFG